MLYYPFLNPPTAVLNQALLYWDAIATIAPPSGTRHLDDRMRAAAAAGLYSPLEARRVYQPYTLAYLAHELDDLLAAVPADDLMISGAQEGDPWRTMNASKLDRSVIEELQRRGLVRLHDDWRDHRRLEASPTLLMILFSMNARRIADETNSRSGCTAEDALRPYTDVERAHWIGHEPLRHSGADACWRIELGRLLPAPTGDVMIGDLLAFRDRYDDERRRLMIAIDQLLHELQKNFDHPDDVLRMLDSKIDAAVADLTRAAKSAQIGLTVGSVAVTVAVGAVSMAAHVDPLLAASLTVLSGVATNIGSDRISRVRGRWSSDSDFSYLQKVRQLAQ